MPFDTSAFHLGHPFLEVGWSDRLVACASVELLLDGLVALDQLVVIHVLWKHIARVARKVIGVVVVDNLRLGLVVLLLDLVLVILLQLQNGSWCETAGFWKIVKAVVVSVVSMVLCTRGLRQNAFLK